MSFESLASPGTSLVASIDDSGTRAKFTGQSRDREIMHAQFLRRAIVESGQQSVFTTHATFCHSCIYVHTSFGFCHLQERFAIFYRKVCHKYQAKPNRLPSHISFC
jgi:hypothetical protein